MLVLFVAVEQRLGVERYVRQVGPGELRLVAHYGLGDAVRLVVEDEREQVIARVAPASAALIGKDAQLLGHGVSHENGLIKKLPGDSPGTWR